MNQLADIDVSAGLTSAWENIADAVPKIVVFLLILIVGYFVARAIEKLLDRLLERVGFDRWVERGGLKRALDRSQLDASRLLGRIVFYALMLVVLATAFGVFGPNPVTAYLDAAVAYLPKLFVALLIIVIAAAIASAVRTIVRASLGATGYGDLLANLAGGIVVALGVFAALNQLEIAPLVVNAVLYASLAAVVGVIIVAVGGGGIDPMRERWGRALRSYDESRDAVMEERRAMTGDDRYREDLRRTLQSEPDSVDVREELDPRRQGL
jgi:hypothetical protein